MIRITTNSGSRKYPSWVARISGRHPQYKYKREFLTPTEDGWLEKIWELADGLYQVQDAGERYCLKVENGVANKISESELEQELNQ